MAPTEDKPQSAIGAAIVSSVKNIVSPLIDEAQTQEKNSDLQKDAPTEESKEQESEEDAFEESDLDSRSPSPPAPDYKPRGPPVKNAKGDEEKDKEKKDKSGKDKLGKDKSKGPKQGDGKGKEKDKPKGPK